MTTTVKLDPASNDFRLIEEAIARLQRSHTGAAVDHESLRSVMSDQIERGRRDLFTLIRVGRRSIEER